MPIASVHQLAAAARARRIELGLSQAALAGRARVSRWWVTEFESGRSRAELGLVMRLLDALELDVDLTPRGSGGERPRHDVDLDRMLDEYGDR
jgi:transcriptional regulator with XRE-family HTH domain